MYQYHKFYPDIRLSPWVKYYWLASGFTQNEVIPKVFPDGCTDVIFVFDKATGWSYIGIFGTLTTFVEVNRPESSIMFGICFRPAGITAFTRISMEEFTDRSAELPLIESLFDKSFYEAFPEKESVAEIVSHTDSYLMSKLHCLRRPDRQIVRAVDLISHAKGQLSLAGVASDVCLCQRHFERKFKAAIGVSPKMFAKINRFKHTVHSLLNYENKDLMTIALECGYYDHTHLIKECKSLTGDTPNEFRQRKSIFYAFRE
jgi:AraC-like DNA-binding protein